MTEKWFVQWRDVGGHGAVRYTEVLADSKTHALQHAPEPTERPDSRWAAVHAFSLVGQAVTERSKAVITKLYRVQMEKVPNHIICDTKTLSVYAEHEDLAKKYALANFEDSFGDTRGWRVRDVQLVECVANLQAVPGSNEGKLYEWGVEWENPERPAEQHTSVVAGRTIAEVMSCVTPPPEYTAEQVKHAGAWTIKAIKRLQPQVGEPQRSVPQAEKLSPVATDTYAVEIEHVDGGVVASHEWVMVYAASKDEAATFVKNQRVRTYKDAPSNWVVRRITLSAKGRQMFVSESDKQAAAAEQQGVVCRKPFAVLLEEDMKGNGEGPDEVLYTIHATSVEDARLSMPVRAGYSIKSVRVQNVT